MPSRDLWQLRAARGAQEGSCRISLRRAASRPPLRPLPSLQSPMEHTHARPQATAARGRSVAAHAQQAAEAKDEDADCACKEDTEEIADSSANGLSRVHILVRFVAFVKYIVPKNLVTKRCSLAVAADGQFQRRCVRVSGVRPRAPGSVDAPSILLVPLHCGLTRFILAGFFLVRLSPFLGMAGQDEDTTIAAHSVCPARGQPRSVQEAIRFRIL